MEALNTLASNGIYSLLAVVFVFVALVILVRKGAISYNGKGLQVGKIKEEERTVIRNQLEYCHTMFEGFVSRLLQAHPSFSAVTAKYISGRCEDVMQTAIVLNHMTTSKAYIQIKQDLIYNTVIKRSTDNYFLTDEFKQECYDFVESMIKQLVLIREEGVK